LRVCPDTDAVLFRLAGVFNDEQGYGVRDETYALLDQMGRLGEPDWFRLGDRDLAFHVLRTSLLRGGARLTEAVLELGRRLGLQSQVLPVTDDVVRTSFHTDAGRLGFQEYFVRERLRPQLVAIEFEGLDSARPSPEALAAVCEADLVVIGPSNPLVSIAPITGLLGPHLVPERTVAVTPLVGGKALKGPTVEMLRAVRGVATLAQVAREYQGLAAWLVIDQVDAGARHSLEAEGWRVLEADTVMRDPAAVKRLAEAILSGVLGARST
jgi:LPPG:FO 2-phospho-L-lactate transferase